jgi:hypothetical protein
VAVLVVRRRKKQEDEALDAKLLEQDHAEERLRAERGHEKERWVERLEEFYEAYAPRESAPVDSPGAQKWIHAQVNKFWKDENGLRVDKLNRALRKTFNADLDT